MIVKVCGVRDPEVAEAAVAAGADWIGLVFAPASPRHASDAEARAVTAAVRGRADVVGVLVSPSPGDCDRVARRWRLAAVQVHGDVSEDLAADCNVPVIRAVNVRSAHEAFTLRWWPDCLVLLDAAPAALPGGTGERVPLPWAAEVARHRRIVLAGGLGPSNVASAIAEVGPAGVDASSALESSPGVKDVALVTEYVRAARAAFAAAATGAEPRARTGPGGAGVRGAAWADPPAPPERAEPAARACRPAAP